MFSHLSICYHHSRATDYILLILLFRCIFVAFHPSNRHPFSHPSIYSSIRPSIPVAQLPFHANTRISTRSGNKYKNLKINHNLFKNSFSTWFNVSVCFQFVFSTYISFPSPSSSTSYFYELIYADEKWEMVEYQKRKEKNHLTCSIASSIPQESAFTLNFHAIQEKSQWILMSKEMRKRKGKGKSIRAIAWISCLSSLYENPSFRSLYRVKTSPCTQPIAMSFWKTKTTFHNSCFEHPIFGIERNLKE